MPHFSTLLDNNVPNRVYEYANRLPFGTVAIAAGVLLFFVVFIAFACIFNGLF